MLQLTGRSATTVGHNHTHIQVRSGKTLADPDWMMASRLGNCQDMSGINFTTHSSGVHQVSFAIHDGSSDAKSSEVGAGLFAQWAAIQLSLTMQKYTRPELVAENMYLWYLATMRDLIGLHPLGKVYLSKLELCQAHGTRIDRDPQWPQLRQVYDWIKNNLLFCIILGHFNPEGFLGLRRGDGGFCIDSEIDIIEYDDVPPYLAYHFFPQERLTDGVTALLARGKEVQTPPPGFDCVYRPDTQHVAGFSDGMPIKRLDQIWNLLTPVELWDQRRNKLNETLVRKWWRELLNPNMPDEGWLIADDLSLFAFTYITIE